MCTNTQRSNKKNYLTELFSRVVIGCIENGFERIGYLALMLGGEDPFDMNLWLATWDNGVSRFDGDEFQNFTKQDGLVHDRVYFFRGRRYNRPFYSAIKSQYRNLLIAGTLAWILILDHFPKFPSLSLLALKPE